MKMRVDFVDQPDPMDKRMKGTDATTGDRFHTGTHLVMYGTISQHRIWLRPPMLLTQTTLYPCFPITQNLPIFSHLKCLFLWCVGCQIPNNKPANQGISAFYVQNNERITLG